MTKNDGYTYLPHLLLPVNTKRAIDIIRSPRSFRINCKVHNRRT